MSESSPAAGSDKGAAGKQGSRKQASRKQASFEVVFQSLRMRHLGWALFHLTFGGLLILKLGTVAKGLGVLFVVLGVLRAIKFARRIGGPEAAIKIGGETIHLPAKLTTKPGERTEVRYEDVTSVFYLRRSIAWFRVSPILIVEADSKVFRYPRDWFASDSDQRRVADAIATKQGRQLAEELIKPLEADPGRESTANARRNRGFGLFITCGVLIMMANLDFTLGFGNARLPTAGVYIIAAGCFLAGAYFLFVPTKSDELPAKSGGS